MKENLHNNLSFVPITIEIKNKTNWLVAFITSVGLLILFCIILIIIFTGLQSASFITLTLPFGAFFIFILYIWLWNNFGKTVLTIDHKTLTVQYKNKLFTSPKTYLKEETDRIETKDFKIEKHQLGVRYHFSISGSTYSVILIQKDTEIRIVDWVTKDRADEIAGELKRIWY
ncbi:putative membrane protein [Chryseobacterium sediminis]|uniref:Membrane protein n=1 Tax=Chryseobacterium sediminis TaxID=1679494 RepID=A0ABR6Q1I8_9FLAO|nr:hypothetical protein [Chryseobacterium sediminis]MBB6331835.1 putative membrane protein [Chryseobacterium sediminis]